MIGDDFSLPCVTSGYDLLDGLVYNIIEGYGSVLIHSIDSNLLRYEGQESVVDSST